MFAKPRLGRLMVASLVFMAALGAIAGTGTLDSSLTNTTDNVIYSIIPQTNGKILIGGAFSIVNHTNHFAVARLLANGSLDPTFTNSMNQSGIVYTMLQQPDGKLLVGGNFTTRSNGQDITRLNSDGSIDASFTNVIVSSNITCLALQPDGRILIGSRYLNSINNSNRNFIARLNSDGSPDFSFNAGVMNGIVSAIAVQSDGGIMIGGSFTYFATYAQTRPYLARLLTNGAVDASYNSTVTNVINALYLEPGDNLLASGPLSVIARLNPAGQMDTAFASNNITGGTSIITEDGNGRIYVCSITNNVGYYSAPRRLLSNGILDLSFNLTTSSLVSNHIPVYALAVQSDTKILLGCSNSIGGITRTNLIRLIGDYYPAEIVSQPTNTGIPVGTNVTLSVLVNNPTPVTYQWSKNGTNIPGATFSQYTVYNAQTNDSGSYSVYVATSVGGTNSSSARVFVGILPTIVLGASSVTVFQGQTAYLTATVTDSDFPYTWLLFDSYFIGTNLPLVISNAQPSNAGNYYLSAENELGQVTSGPLLLTVLGPGNVQAHLNSNNAAIQMLATPGSNYILQAATNLQAPIFWQNLVTNPADTNGLWSYLDTNTAAFPSRYYRLLGP